MYSLAQAFGLKVEQCWYCNSEIGDNYHFWPEEPERKFCTEQCCYDSLETPEGLFGYTHVRELVKDIRTVLLAYGLPYSSKFLSPDGLVIAALLCNAAAKSQEWGALQEFPYFYDIKPFLVAQAAGKHLNVWYEREQEVVYFETSVGQISFHVFFGEGPDWTLLSEPNGRKWEPRYMQDNAEAIAKAFLNENNHYLELELVRFLESEA